ncbi:MAG TPA: tetratricopeptide repeat protein [Xenococcaceae cyanobacterium]|jgi:tetratricopeptide (TPR) repeat protein
MRSKSFWQFGLGLTLVFCLGWGQFATSGLSSSINSVPRQQPASLVNQGVVLYQQGDYPSAKVIWEKALQQYQQHNNLAQAAIVRENLARVEQQLGAIETAIAYWSNLISYYRQQGNQEKVGRLLTEQAQAYNYWGQQQKAIAILCGNLAETNNLLSTSELARRKCVSGSAIALAQETKDKQGEAAAWGSLGEAYRLQRNYQQALVSLEASLKIAQQYHLTIYLVAVNHGLGNLYSSLARVASRRANSAQQAGDLLEAQQLQQQAREEDKQALSYYEQSLALALIPNNKLLNQFTVN